MCDFGAIAIAAVVVGVTAFFGVVGKVVRIEENEDGQYNVGVVFIKKGETIPGEVVNLVK